MTRHHPRKARRLTPGVLARQSRAAPDPLPSGRGGVRSGSYFLCPTVTPLWYAPGYRDLGADDQRLYNQLTALMGIEIIGWFETTFLPALNSAGKRLAGRGGDGDLVTALQGFAADEREHIGWWRTLHAESLSAMGLDPHTRLVRIRPPGRWVLDHLAHSSKWVSAVYWIMLALEEHSLEIARRTLASTEHSIDPRHREAHRHHQRDEARHVQLDWHLIDRFYRRQTPVVRSANAALFGWLLTRYLLPPVRSACEVIDHLARLRPEVRPRAATLKQQLAAVAVHPDYRAMMYSRHATPVLFTLFDTCPEMNGLARRLQGAGDTSTGAHTAC